MRAAVSARSSALPSCSYLFAFIVANVQTDNILLQNTVSLNEINGDGDALPAPLIGE